MTSQIPYEILEERAAEQRRQLHNSVTELRSSVRERLDVKRTVNQHFAAVAGITGLVALVVGWGFAGLFVD